jgi:hypothetical protein
MDALNLSEEKARALLHAVKQTGEPAVEPDPIVPPTSELATAISDSIRALPALELKYTERNIDPVLDPEDIVLHLSDCQVGSVVDAAATGGLGCYNHLVFRERAERLRNAVSKILRYLPNKIERCHVVFGGDIVDGRTIFRGHQRQTDLGVVQQVIESYEVFSHLLIDLLGLGFEELVVTSVPGNHARIGMKGELGPEDNLDLLLHHFLKERLRDVPGIRFNNPTTWWALLEVRGWRFLVAHGDEVKSWMNLPFYGMAGFRNRMRELLRESFAGNADFDYVFVGHHHQIAAFQGIYLNGSWVGGSEFSLKTMQSGGLPYQRIVGVHDNIGISWDRKIVLADRRQLPAAPVFQ